MVKKLFEHKAPYQLVQILRYLGFTILCLLLCVSFITEIVVGLESLYLIPFIFLALAFEEKIYQKVEYHYGKEARQSAIFLVDIFLCSLFVAAIHALIIPSFVLICALLFFATYTKVPKFIVLSSTIIAVATFYFSSVLFFGFEPYLQSSSRELNILSLLFFMIYISLFIYYQQYQYEQLQQENSHQLDELNRYLKLNNQLARYAPVQLWQSIMRGEFEARIEYKHRKLTIFFSDIQGFTDLSENLIPDDLAFLLNDYLRHMTEIAKHYGGTIDKFMGDGMLIFYGDPNSRGEKEDALACLDMAVTMRQQMRILRERWIKMGYTSLNVRMGIATGYCHVGNYGTAHRMSYTIVGRDANIASRLQTAAQVDQILISEETFNLVKDEFLCIKHEPLILKGISEPVKSWQVVERYHESIEKYRTWFDFESKGFNLLLNLDKTPIYDYPELIQVMQEAIERIKLQQQRTDQEGAVMLSKEHMVQITQSDQASSK
ncbi:Adenylate cyclase, class 3 [Acinetobacter marinus]|uniref:Adenylate cyclase, class 3 n=1 Tax=Acinetobacter marinus TaxID=281375 RepID=A0A1G6GIT2_9GAMM|nr:adenylate/guanylate cyclase domain-containing protein [Acinetobacter marinus]SDB81922.1 Adenylate cyclase, class 3 [Acinetobacter marinus]